MNPSKCTLFVSLVALVSLSGCSLFDTAEPLEDPSDPSNQKVYPDDARELFADCDAPLYAAGLTADWTTPNTIRWSWDYSGSDEPLDTFVLVLGPSEEAVRERSDETELYGPAQARELSKVTGEFRRTWSVTDGHDPETDYFAQLVAVDPNGCTSASNVAQALTKASVAGKEIVIFSEEATEGYSIPPEIVLSNRAPYGGDFHYEWEAECPGEPSCYEIVRRQNLGIKITTMSEAEFDGAFLEFATLNEGYDVDRSEQVRFGLSIAGETRWYSRDLFVTTAPSRDYRLHQIPLREMLRDGEPLSWDVLTAGTLREFGFGGTWTAGTMVSFDEVRLRF